MSSITLSVHIAGRDYTLTSGGSAEQAQRVATLVDRKMRELMAGGVSNRETAAVLAALTYAEELLRAEDDNTRLRRRLDVQPHD